MPKVRGYAGRRPEKARQHEAWPGSLTPVGFYVVHQRSTGTTQSDRWVFRKVDENALVQPKA